jgi:hypothetical protein
MADGLFDTLIKRLMKFNSSMQPQVRTDQVEQYLNPDQDIIPKTDYRPTKLTKFLNRTFRSQAEYMPSTIELPDSIVGKAPPAEPVKLDSQTVFGHGPNPKLMFEENMPLERRLGLGNATISIGGGPSPYLSIFDSWDDPSRQNYIDRQGVPFNVYDRIPINLVDGKIPKTISGRGKDIELPNQGQIDPRIIQKLFGK